MVAGVVATEADGMATCVGMFQYGRSYCQCSRWDNHWVYVLCGADGSVPFLDTLVTSQTDGSLLTTIYRKLTHIN